MIWPVLGLYSDSKYPDRPPIEVIYSAYRGETCIIRQENKLHEIDKEYFRSTNSRWRYVFIEELATQVQLFVATIRLNKIKYDQLSAENPLFKERGGSIQFKYVLGDKIHFAMTLRLIDERCAQKLLDWINNWS